MDLEAFYKITQGLYVLGASDDGKKVGSLVDAVMQIANNPLVLAVSCHNNSYTKSCIEKTGRFSLSALAQDIPPEVIGNFGFFSSESREKWSYVAHDVYDGLPFLRDNIAVFVCKVLQTIAYDSNTLILGLVEAAWNGENKEPITYQYYRTNLKQVVVDAWLKQKEDKMADNHEKHWICTVCGYVYDGEVPFEELPDTWVCPVCGVDKSFFSYE